MCFILRKQYSNSILGEFKQSLKRQWLVFRIALIKIARHIAINIKIENYNEKFLKI